MSMRTPLDEKEQRLLEYLRQQLNVMIAFSGGVDSTYLMTIAQEALGDKAKGVLFKGTMLAQEEAKEAVALAEVFHFPLVVLEMDMFQVEGFVANAPERCYFCKTAIFQKLLAYGQATGVATVLDGTNASDEGDYRPGRKALAELGIGSPLKTLGLTKEEIRELSRRRGLPTWNKPSMACLASRIPYGERITEARLRQVEQAEDFLRSQGFRGLRVRTHQDLARIEVPLGDFPRLLAIQKEVNAAFHQFGLRYITLDLEGLRSGSLNPAEGQA